MDSLKALVFIVFYLAIVYFIVKHEYKKKSFEIDAKPLSEQTLFRLAIIIPVVSFLYFGAFAWWGKTPVFSAHGFERFIKISTLPLGLLSLAIPFTAVINNIHRTVQTNEQIEQTKKKNVSDLFYSHRKDFITYIDDKLADTQLLQCDMSLATKRFFTDNTPPIRTYLTMTLNLKLGSSYLTYKKLYSNSSPTNANTAQPQKLNNRIKFMFSLLEDGITKIKDNLKNQDHEDIKYIINSNGDILAKMSRCIAIMYASINYHIDNKYLNKINFAIKKDDFAKKTDYYFELSTIIVDDKSFKFLLNSFIRIYNILINYDGMKSFDINRYTNLKKYIDSNDEYIESTFAYNGYDPKFSYGTTYNKGYLKEISESEYNSL